MKLLSSLSFGRPLAACRHGADMCTCMNIHTYIRVYVPRCPVSLVPRVRTSAVLRLGYKVGILRVLIVSCRPLGDCTVGACTGTFLPAMYVVGGTSLLELYRIKFAPLARSLTVGYRAYLWVPWVSVLYVGTTCARSLVIYGLARATSSVKLLALPFLVA